MDRTPRQPDGGDRFEAVLRELHKLARRSDKDLKGLTEYLLENPAESTRHMLYAIPEQMDVWHREMLDKYGYDLDRHEWASGSSEGSLRSLEDAKTFIALLNHHGTYRFIMKLWEWFVENELSGRLLLEAVCRSVEWAYRARPGLAAKGIEVLEAGASGLPQGLALSAYLSAHVATHTSLHKNRRLRAGIDELRTDGESRFSRLLKELPAEVLIAYREREAGWGDLMDVRTEAARRLEKKGPPPANAAQELAAFADREILLKHARAARLSPRELEVFELLVGEPKLSYREIATRLGISVSQVGVIKHRTKNKLIA